MLNRREFAKRAAAVSLLPQGPASGGVPTHGSQPGTGLAFSVMLWALDRQSSLEGKLDAVAQAGYPHVEFVAEYRQWDEAQWTRMLAKLRALSLSVDAIAGVQGGFADPNGGDAYLASLGQVVVAARRLGCRQIILLSGNVKQGMARVQQRAAAIATLRRAAGLLGAAGMTGVIEPIDLLENPDIYLDGVAEAFDLVRAVGSPHLKVLYDLYHEQRGRGNLIEKLEKHIDDVGLIHVADVPGRHAPGTGEINFCRVYQALAKLGYRGVIAMEFYPAGDTAGALRAAREEAIRCFGTQRG